MRFPSLLFGLSVVLAATGCDSTGIDGPNEGGHPCSSNCHPGGGDDSDARTAVVDLDPRQTYLRTYEGGAVDAPALSLTDNGVSAGDRLCFAAEGDYVYGPGDVASNTGRPLAIAVFSSSSELLDASQRYRVAGAIDAGPDVETLPTLQGGYATDIPQDFDATDACVTIPVGARFIFFSAYDDQFEDNSRIDGTPYRVRVTLE